MFRDLRRSKQQLNDADCFEILEKGKQCVLAVQGDDGYPYTIPLNYAYYKENTIYFHSAKKGHKIDAINNNPKVSLCIIDKDDIIPQEYTTYFRSVVAFGKAQVVENDEEKLKGMKLLNAKYAPNQPREDELIAKEWEFLAIVKIDLEHISGKEAIELVKARNVME